MSLSLSSSINTANEYYGGEVFLKTWTTPPSFEVSRNNIDYEKLDYDDELLAKLKPFIIKNDLNGLKNCPEFKVVDINHRFSVEQKTFLHLAYQFNKPEIVDFLLKNGADERISSDAGRIPMQYAKDDYKDSLPRVVNEVVLRYFKSSGDAVLTKDPHRLFEIIQDFVHEHHWKYVDSPILTRIIPFRDGREISSLGSPELAYNVNCADLSHLFIRAAQKIGIEAEEVWYRGGYKSILQTETEKRGVIGKLKMFDRSTEFEKKSHILFDSHCVAYSSGWHFDLTLMCKYQEKNAVLSLK